MCLYAYIHVCICIHVIMHVYVFVCMSGHSCGGIYIYVCMYICMYVCLTMCMCIRGVCVCAHMCVKCECSALWMLGKPHYKWAVSPAIWRIWGGEEVDHYDVYREVLVDKTYAVQYCVKSMILNMTRSKLNHMRIETSMSIKIGYSRWNAD